MPSIEFKNISFAYPTRPDLKVSPPCPVGQPLHCLYRSAITPFTSTGRSPFTLSYRSLLTLSYRSLLTLSYRALLTLLYRSLLTLSYRSLLTLSYRALLTLLYRSLLTLSYRSPSHCLAHHPTLSYRSSSSPQVLDSVDLLVGVGEVVAIVGPSGSGKSSLSLLLLHLYHPSEGQVGRPLISHWPHPLTPGPAFGCLLTPGLVPDHLMTCMTNHIPDHTPGQNRSQYRPHSKPHNIQY